MSFFALVNPEELSRITTDDGSAWIDVSAAITKKEYNKLVLQGPRDAEDRAGSLSFVDRVVGDMVKGWSFVDDDGAPVAFDIKVYQQLNASAANWISGKVMEHFAEITKGVEDATVEKPEDSE